MSFKPVIMGWKRFISRRHSPWAGLATSVTGATHRARKLPNQDFAQIAVTEKGAVAAVADGHSMASCCRAEDGSRIAVEVTIETCLGWLSSVDMSTTPSIEVVVELSEAIHARWHRRVRADIGLYPFTAEEKALIEPLKISTAAYGSTLAAAVTTEGFCLALQIGDGQVIAVSNTGVTGQLIVPAELDGEASDSLCHPEAIEKFRYAIVTFDEFQPAAIMCTTDGYDKAFRSVGEFLQIGSLYLQSLRSVGPEELAAALPAELRNASDQGSGDDVSCAILYRKDLCGHGIVH